MSKRAPANFIIPTCYWWHDHDTGEWIMIPGCMARAMDPHACSCTIPPSRIERERAKRRAANKTIERLRDRLIGARHEANEAVRTMKHWRGVLRAHGIDPSQHNPPGG